MDVRKDLGPSRRLDDRSLVVLLDLAGEGADGPADLIAMALADLGDRLLGVWIRVCIAYDDLFAHLLHLSVVAAGGGPVPSVAHR